MIPTSRGAAAVGVAGLLVFVLGQDVGLALSVLVVIAIVVDALLVRQAPAVTRDVPPLLPRGLPYDYTIVIDHGATPAGKIRARQPSPADVVFEPASGAATIRGTVVATRRGAHRLPPVTVRQTGPLGLGAWQHDLVGGGAVTVYPDVITARRIARTVATGRFQAQGRRRSGRHGLGTEFESVREYDDNDDIRFLNWSASLRLGRPMTNQFRVEQDRDVICVLDTGRLMAAPLGGMTRLDAAVDATAAIAYTADGLGDRVGVVAFASKIRRDRAPVRRGGEEVVHAVHDLEPEDGDADYESAFRRVARHKRALVVLFTDLLDDGAAAPLLDAIPILARKHAVVVAYSTDEDLVTAITRRPASLDEVLQAAVATEALDEQASVVARLRHHGVPTIDARRGALPTACVAAYLDAKATVRV